MRVSYGGNLKPAPTQPVPVVPLAPDVSKSLIAGGVFQPTAGHVVWAAPGSASPASQGLPSLGTGVALASGISFQPWALPKPHESLPAVFRELAEQSAGILEHSGLEEIADGFAVIAAAPDILHAMTSPDVDAGKKAFLIAANFTKALSFVNQFAPIPHAEVPLQVVTALFKVGEQVYIAGIDQPTAGR